MGSVVTALSQFGLNPGSPLGSESNSIFPQETKQPAASEMSAAATPPASLVGAPATTTITTPTGGATDTSTAAGYVPNKPNLISLNTQSTNLSKLFKAAYTPDDSIKSPQRSSLSNTDASAGYDNQEAADAVQHGNNFIAAQAQNPPPTDSTVALSDTNRAIGNTTTFGLDYNTGGYDSQDNGKGAFGYNTRDPNLEGASLPIEVIKQSIGDYTRDPKIYAAIKRGDYQVNVTGPDGKSRLIPIVDAGPAEWTGNALDLTYKSSHDFNTGGKAKLGYQIIGPDGGPVLVKGFHPGSISRTNWDDHIGSSRKQIPAGPAEPAKPEPIPNASPEPAKRVPVTKTSTTVTAEGGAAATVNGKPVTSTKAKSTTVNEKGDEIEDMGEKPKEGRSEEAPAKKGILEGTNPKTGKSMTDADYGRYGVDVPADEMNKEIDKILEETK